MIHPQTAFLIVGLLFVALPVTAWTILHNRHDRISVSIWCAGGLLYGLGFMLIGLRGTIPAWLAFTLANPITFAAYPFRAVALKRELGEHRGHALTALPWVLASLAYVVAYYGTPIEAPRLVVALSVNLVGSAWLGWLAWTLYRRKGYRSAAMLASTDGLFALALLVRLIAVLANWQEARAMAASLDFAIALVSSVLVSLYGNLGYIGIALETTSDQELARTTELAREQERRLQTELRLQEQATSHSERERLLAQREEMLAVLAHEVRQPLNNASAALQSATEAMSAAQGDRLAAQTRLGRASAVLTQITSSLDNTLADAVLLGDTKPITRQDTDIDTFVNLVLAEIEPMQRDRVVRERATNTRTASMNAGLMRLALRNLLGNALAYSPADQPVVVRISDSDEPLALVIEVCDQGDGIPPELLPRLFTRGARAADGQQRHGHGLGLYIVQRIMAMHGGEVKLQQSAPRGLTMSLVIPQAFSE